MDNNQKIKILIVEDTKTQAMSLKFILDHLGYDATIARNGKEGIEKMNAETFPIVITDWVMPEMDGHDFCVAIRKQQFQGYVYIILLTTKDTTDDIVVGLEAGADDYLVKPVDNSELAARLNTAKRIIELEGSLRKQNEEISRLSITDALTGAFNRRFLNQALPAALKRAFRYNQPLSIVLADLDHFKNINDTYGHLAGDHILEVFCTQVKHAIRDTIDWVVRYGGEEFLIVLPETNAAGATAAAERYRMAIVDSPIVYDDKQINISVSFGVASIEKPPKDCQITMERFISDADECLYRAKNEGRNRYVSILTK